MIPPPEQIKREIKARPVPANMNKKTLADIENDKYTKWRLLPPPLPVDLKMIEQAARR